jgi:hypothetical protein
MTGEHGIEVILIRHGGVSIGTIASPGPRPDVRYTVGGTEYVVVAAYQVEPSEGRVRFEAWVRPVHQSAD